MKMSWSRSAGVRPRSGTPSIRGADLAHGRAVLDEVEVGPADAAGLDVDERPGRRPGTGSATSSRTSSCALAEDDGAHQPHRPRRSRPARKSSSAALTSAAASCWTQWPAPSTSTVPRWSVTELVHRRRRAHREDRVVGAADEQRRHLHRGAVEVGGELPVAVEVAVPVEAAGEPGAGELGDVVVELGLGQPRRQAVRFGDALDEPPPVVGHRRRVGRRRPGRCGSRRGGGASSSPGPARGRRRRRRAAGSTPCRRTSPGRAAAAAARSAPASGG